MKVIKIIIQIALLYAIAWVGGWISQTFHLPIPGSIIGLLLLFILLLSKIIPVGWIEAGSNTLMFYLPLFFIPATVGVMNHFELFAGKGWLLIGIVIVSTAITIAVAGHVSQWLAKWNERRGGDHYSIALTNPEKSNVDQQSGSTDMNSTSASSKHADSIAKEVRL